MMGFIDIHSHILPKVDDGPFEMDKSVDMLRIAYEQGIRTIIATPHFRENVYDISQNEIEQQIREIKKYIKNEMPEMKIYSGREVYYNQDIIEMLNKKKVATMANSKYVLIEFSQDEEYINIVNGLQTILFGGYLPILAHTERYFQLGKDHSRIEHIVKMGAFIQVNASSIDGELGKYFCKTAKTILKKRLVHFVATDAHSNGVRSPKLQKSFKIISKLVNEDYAKQIMIANPEKIINKII